MFKCAFHCVRLHMSCLFDLNVILNKILHNYPEDEGIYIISISKVPFDLLF